MSQDEIKLDYDKAANMARTFQQGGEQLLDTMQEMQKLTSEQAYAIMPLFTQMGNVLQGSGMAAMAEASARILMRRSRPAERCRHNHPANHPIRRCGSREFQRAMRATREFGMLAVRKQVRRLF